jgi:hypothetical protein
MLLLLLLLSVLQSLSGSGLQVPLPYLDLLRHLSYHLLGYLLLRLRHQKRFRQLLRGRVHPAAVGTQCCGIKTVQKSSGLTRVMWTQHLLNFKQRWPRNERLRKQASRPVSSDSDSADRQLSSDRQQSKQNTLCSVPQLRRFEGWAGNVSIVVFHLTLEFRVGRSTELNHPDAFTNDSAISPASNNEPSTKDTRHIDVNPTSDGDQIILSERYDVAPGRLLLALAEYVPNLKDLKTSGLRQYLKHEGELAVRYTDPGIGRMQIEPFGFDRKGNEQDLKITCQAHLWNWAKAVMCAKFYKDMDICNCHPVLLVQICKQHDLPL